MDDELFDSEDTDGMEGLRVELFYSYYDSNSYEARPEWINEAQDEINEFLEGKTVYAMDMDFAGSDKNRIYGKILYSEE
ncbi:MAG: hypothetical protein SVU32_08910 [Candidatus Nanohaloarchaea archaeon]|nr:hypothetical protein [Candidatus Nanohaloarchaea archaeon]